MKSLHVVAILTGLTCAGLQAETMTAKVPFDFQIGSTPMRAGNYQVNYSTGIVTLRNVDDNQTVVALARSSYRWRAPSTAVLEFRCYGSRRFLAGLWGPNEQTGRTLPPSKQEKALADHGITPAPAAIALGGR